MSIMKNSVKPGEKHRKGTDAPKITVMALLILLCLWVSHYYHFVLRSDILVTHFFYLPVVFAGFWWGRRAIWIAVLLGGYLLALHAFLVQGVSIMVDIQRVVILITVGLVVSALREEGLRTERTLRESESRYRDLFENANDLIQSVDAEGKFVYVNRKWLETLGYTEQEVNTMTFTDILRKDQVPHCMELFEKISHGESIAHVETVFMAKDGREIVVEGNASARFEDGKLTASRGIFRDVTDRRQTEKLTNNILESMTEGLITVDHEYKIIAANRAYCQRVGIPAENVIGQYCYKVSHHIDTPCHEAGEDCAVRHTFETGEPHTVIHTHYDREGSPLYLETRSYPIKNEQGKIISVIETLNDITDKVKLEEELRSAAKMAAVGQLSAGIAHDFNNILAAITGYASVLRIKLGNDGPLLNNAEKILALTEKAANLIRSLLTFSRTQLVRKGPVKLNDILRSVEQLLPDILGKNIELKIVPVDGDLTLMADAVRLEQGLRILAENARDAMPRGGRFTFSMKRIEPDKTFRETHEFVQTCPYVLISVSDTGSGMDKATMTRIFEPFFTTKEVGKGTGLGLATAYGIIKQHDGYIDVQSEPDKGTTFRIYLPVEDKGG